MLSHARMILSWYEHLPEEDIPPRWMWHLDDELEDHFQRVKDRREAGLSGRGDDDEGFVIRNEYAKGRGRGG